jgi:peptide/nickel transport system ATP-binding protein
MALLDVRALTVAFDGAHGPVTVVDGVSFAVAPGESFGIVGESGCGKTLTALAVMGLLPPGARASGSVKLDGSEILNAGDDLLSGLRGRRMAMVFQEPMRALNPVRTIAGQVAEGARIHLGLGAAAARDRARELLDHVGLPASRFPPDLYPHELSGGQRQRVVIAIALAAGPALIIADEPTTALDVTTQARILDLIVEVTDAEGAALVLISHDLGVIAEMTDRMMVMYAGMIAEHGPTAAVFAAMAHPYTVGLFNALPAMREAAGARFRTIPGKVPPPGPALRIGCPFAPRCRSAGPRCRAGLPPPVSLSPGHEAMCFFPGHP